MTEDEQDFYTRCPHCNTMFRVLERAIEASQGWVKCGRCHKVFDCRDHEVDAAEFQKDEQEVSKEDNPPPPQAPSVASKADLFDDNDPQLAMFGGARPAKNAPGKPVKPAPAPESGVTDSTETPGAPKLEPPESDATQSGNGQVKAEVSVVAPAKMEPGFLRIDEENGSHTPQLVAENRRKQQEAQQPSKRKEEPVKTENPWLSRTIQAGAQSWKKEKNRFKPQRKYSAAILSVLLLALLLWQVAIVSYSRLSSYRFMSGPLSLVCSVLTCNATTPPITNELDILYANLRRHASRPNVISISAKLINYSNGNIDMPVIRLDLTDAGDQVIASRLIDLGDNPQYVEPPVSELAPGQDVTMTFNIDNPDPAIQGFELGFAGSE